MIFKAALRLPIFRKVGNLQEPGNFALLAVVCVPMGPRRGKASIADPPSKRGPKLLEFVSSPHILEKITNLSLIGLSEEQIAHDCFDVSIETWARWKKAKPEIANAVKEAGDITGKVVRSLAMRAIGYSHPAVKIMMTRDGEVVKVPYIEHYPPDTLAAIFYLKNKAAEFWKDRQEHDLSTGAKQVMQSWAAAVKRLNPFAEQAQLPVLDAEVVEA